MSGRSIGYAIIAMDPTSTAAVTARVKRTGFRSRFEAMARPPLRRRRGRGLAGLERAPLLDGQQDVQDEDDHADDEDGPGQRPHVPVRVVLHEAFHERVLERA